MTRETRVREWNILVICFILYYIRSASIYYIHIYEKVVSTIVTNRLVFGGHKLPDARALAFSQYSTATECEMRRRMGKRMANQNENFFLLCFLH